METLDKFDWAILNELQTNGRLTNAELAQRVGLSAAPCWRRVRALEESGVIKGYRAEIDRQKVGLDVLAFVRLDAEQQDWAVAHARGLVEVTGTLEVGRQEERDGRVSWFRLQLAPEAIRGMNRFEVTQYLHSLQHTH